MMMQQLELREKRLATLSPIIFPANLPIAEHLEQIATLLQTHPVIIVAGDTGSGKTTQLPKLCLTLQRGLSGRIGHTQPRRIAARAVATRIAQELQTIVGDVVGYKTRFQEQLSPHTAIKVMTDGILLAELVHDKLLRQYDTLIIDEAHERSVNIDFILGILKQLLPKRPDLKIIVTSATLDVARFSKYFYDAPVVSVAGRGFPVDIIYQPEPMEQTLNSPHENLLENIVTLAQRRDGDILVFLPTESVIHEVEKLLRHRVEHVEILPLYSRLSAKDQNKVFAPSQQLRIILSTNVAETSLTVSGIRYVVDEGSARISRYSQRMKIQRLPIEKISQASAQQRAGRCGRTAPGICIRLYAKEDFLARDLFTLPEILRTNLAQIILRMTALRLGKIEEFPFIQPPNLRYINDGYQLLLELGALDPHRHLTPLGQQMSQLSIDPRLSRLLLAGKEQGCLAEMLIITSFLEAQDPRLRPSEKRVEADNAHAQYVDKKSDFLSIIHLWQAIIEQKNTLSKNKFRQFCEKNYLSWLRFNEWQEIYTQLYSEVQRWQWQINETACTYERLHVALLTAFFTQIAMRQEKGEYIGTRGHKIKLFPGSGVFKKRPLWIMSGLLLETEQLYAHLVAEIDPQWVIAVASSWVKRHYGEPVWEKKSQRVTVLCRTTLLGLTLQDKQTVNFEPIEPPLAREIFIRGALVQGEWQHPLPFFIENQRRLETARELEAQARRTDILVEEEMIWQFYDTHLPLDITGVKKLAKWYQQASAEEKDRLILSQSFIIQGVTTGLTTEKFPGHLSFQGKTWSLRYQFAPGTAEDGLTVIVPLESLTQVPHALFEWLVLGFLSEKVETILRTLPKLLRKKIMPLSAVAEKFVQKVLPENMALRVALRRFLEKEYQCRITEADLSYETLLPHQKINYCVVNAQQQICAQGRDFEVILAQCQDKARDIQQNLIQNQLPTFPAMTQWQCGDLAPEIALEHAALSFYPALQDKQVHVMLTYFDDEMVALKHHRQGVVRLLFFYLQAEWLYFKKHHSAISLTGITFYQKENVLEEIFLSSIEQTFLSAEMYSLPRSAQAFAQLLADKKNLLPWAKQRSEEVAALFTEYRKVVSKITPAATHLSTKKISLQELKQLKFATKKDSELPIKENAASSSQDIEKQLQGLLYPGFIRETPGEYWPRMILYVQGILRRLEKRSHHPQQEKTLFLQLQPALVKYEELIHNASALQKLSPRQYEKLQHYRWMLEEYRLSLFAQPIKTLFKISEKRLEEEWASLYS